MRIKETSSTVRGTLSPVTLDDKKNSSGFNQNFQRHMSHTNTIEYEKYMNELAQRIHQQGDLVSNKMDLAEFQKYRELIIELFNETASNSYAYYKKDKFDARGRHKVLAVIRRVNQRLDELAAQILNEQKENINNLSIIDDIKGLLVDLFL